MKTKKRLEEFKILIRQMSGKDALGKIKEEIINQEKIIEKYKDNKQVSKYKEILEDLKIMEMVWENHKGDDVWVLE